MKNRKFLAITMTALLFLTLLAGCSAAPTAGEAYNNSADDKYYNKESAMSGELADTVTGTQVSPQSNQKLIRTVNLTAETEDMNALLTAVEQRVTELAGYVETREVYNGSSYASYRSRYAELTVRIPAEKLDQFVAHMEDFSNIISNRETAEDVTLDYVATQSRITALETEQTRLLELLAKAENMEDLLLIEARLTEVRTELEQVTSQLRIYDNLVDYGTVHLSISEVKQYTVVEEPETVWERISTGFVESLQDLGNGFTEIFIFLIVALPYIAVIGLCAAALILWIRVLRKKKRKQKSIPKAPEEGV